MQLYRFVNRVAIFLVFVYFFYNLLVFGPQLIITFIHLLLKIVGTITQTKILSYKEEDAMDLNGCKIVFVILLGIVDVLFGIYDVVRDEHFFILTILSFSSLVLQFTVAITQPLMVAFANTGETGHRVKVFLYRVQNVLTFLLDIFDVTKYSLEISIQYLQSS